MYNSLLMTPRLHIRSLLSPRLLNLVEGTGMRHVFPMHTHRSLVIGLVTAGTRQIIYPDEYLEIQEGEIFIIHPDEIHSCFPASPGHPVNYCALCISPELLEMLFPQGVYFPHHLSGSEAVASLLKHFFAMDTITDPASREAALTCFIHSFAARWSVDKPACTENNPNILWVKTCLEQQVSEHLDIYKLGQMAALSPYHLNRLFRRRVGVPPHTYQLQRKIRYAQDLLSEGKAAVEVALELGFTDQSHFTHFFKKYTGVTPAAYQRQNSC